MFYYIKDGVIGTISEIQIKQEKNILEIEIKEFFEKPFFENGKIIEFTESEFFKKQEDERIKKEIQEQQELQAQQEKQQKEYNDIINTPEYIKQTMIDEIKDLGKQGEELRSKYLSAELLPDSELKTETLRILKEKGDLVMSQYVEKQKTLVEKYGIEILQEIL